MFTTPILVIIFNRPDFAKNIYDSLYLLQPTKLYIVSDGARNEKEKEDVLQSRAVFDKISWDCDVKFNFSEINLGLRQRISGGISWAFENEEKLIILEDDCIPHPDFFKFCEEMLVMYKDDTRIMSINGCNLNPRISDNYSEYYFFSQYANSWGWATWKRAWNLYDSELAGLDNIDVIKNFTFNLPYRYRSDTYWKYMLKKVKRLKIDSWAYRWMFTLWQNKGLAIVPQTNLIQNIGNDRRSTNTRGNLHYINIRTSTINPNKSNNPKHAIANSSYDKWLEDSIYSKSPLNRTIWLFKRLISIIFPNL
jgi:hypothetical protein